MNSTEKLTDHAPFNVASYIWIYVSPVLIALGTIGNVLSIIVLLRPRLRQSTTMFYLACLSFGDLFTLYTGLLRYWTVATFHIDVRNISNGSCKIHTFLVYYSLDFTVWVLVSVTIDRCLSVSMPFRSKRICSLTRSKWVIVVILIVFFLKNMHFFWTVELVHTWEYRCDGFTDATAKFLRYIWPWIDLSTFCVIPFAIMIICNIKIIYEIFVSEKKMNAHCSTSCPMTSSNNVTSHVSCVEGSVQSVQSHSMTSRELHHPKERLSVKNPGNSRKSSRRRISSLTAMLLTVNCVFLITTSPIQAVLIGEEYWFADRTKSDIAWHMLWWAVVNMLQYLNNAIHFFLYCLTGPRFRNELKTIFRRRNKVTAVTTNGPLQTQM